MSHLLLPIGLLPDVGGGEMMMIMLVVLLLFGGEKLPQFAKGLGKAIREFKRAANEVEQEIKRAIDAVPDTPDIKATILSATEDKPKPLMPSSAPAVQLASPTPSTPSEVTDHTIPPPAPQSL
jgi:sec-independent protein translocase protein TatA